MSSPPPIELEVEVGDDTMEVDAPDMLPGERYTLPQADVVLDSWRTKMSEGVLAATHFLDHWRVTVPRIYSPQPNRTCLDWQFDEELASKLLIQPLEHFVLGNSDGTLPTPRRSTLCGRVFKQGEPAYSCRECGMDNTCVLCVECFKVSAHRNHKYKMGQSGGGGCCDCGDTEAWKRDAFCDLHKAPSDESEQDASINPEMIERMKIVASSVLSYCFRLLTHDHAPGLPNDLRLKDAERDPLQILDQPDCYCTVLYNDETHTFEQVISTLTRVTKCNHRDSVELVSLIDREGRALVKCSSFHVCDKLKSDIEMFTARHGPCLKVLVMHAHLVAHQMFAMKLLQWLQNLVGVEVGLRVTVGRVVLSAEGGATGVMLNDHRMWKAARTLWHRLLITTTLMDYDSKKQLAVLFTKNYASMLKDFIRDDHDHSFSISSLSVQLFTTPTLAHYLIAKHDALFIVLNTFISECNRCCNDKGRLEFDRNRVTMSFKRAQFILYDVKYLLSSIPTSYDDDLRKGFLHGLTIMLNLLVMMQGMDSVVRQVGQHTEYEPEWEGAFNLHVKLAHSISLALEWCGQDRIVLASAFRTALRRLSDAETFDVKLLRELGNKSASVIPYDVSSKPVSIHRPLSRFIAGLYLMLDKHGLNYHSKELARPDKPKPTPEELIEPVFRTMAMIAQVQAGMWRRNGFALLNQLYFYHNVKCRAEMLDRDIVMLQIGASLIESNEFIIHMLNKFDLLEWAASDFEQRGIEDDSLRHTISLVEEFLGLLITIIGSRYVPGVGEVTSEERTKKEIIQILCVNPMAHSELNKSLPEDQLHETGLEAVIHDVADFSKPKGNTRGLYTLKPHLYDDYDTFYYHYTREDLSKSEEAQRNRRKAAGLSECCPPPVLPALCPPFRLIASLLQSETSLHVIKTVLQRTLDLRARSFSETQLHKALHLIGYGLRDQESSNYEFVAFAECLQRTGIYEMLIQVAHSQRVEAHQPLAHWLLAKIRSLLGIEDKSSGDVEAMETEKQDKLDTEESAAETEKARRAKLAADRRAAVLAQMQAAQNSFISQNASLFVESEMKEVSEREEVGEGGKVFGGYGVEAQRVERICIMCQEEAEVEFSDDPLVLVAFVQPSTVLRRDSSIRSQPLSAVLPEGIGQALHVSSCGHALHSTCCKKYVDSFVDREKRRPYRLRQPAAFDVEKREYLCPLCERLCNSVLPMVPAPAILSSPAAPLSQEIYQTSVDLVLNHQIMSQSVHLCNESCEDIHCTARARSVGAASSDMDTGDDSAADDPPIYISSHSKDLVPKEFLYNFDMYTPEYPDPLVALIEEFIFNLTQSKVTTETGSLASTAALYKTIAYTILSTDAVFQAEKRPLLGELPARHKDALHSLVRLGAALPTIWKYPHRIAHHAVTSLEVLEKTSPVTQTSFSTLVTVVLSIPSLFAQNSEPAKPNNLARQITLQGLRSTITRALIVANIDECISSNEECPEDLENLLTVTKGVRKGTLKDGLSPTKVWESIKTQCLRFLRCCCLFYHFLSDVTLPPELTVLNGETFEGMCAYLDMPTSFKELIDNEFALKKVFEWSAMSYDLPDSVKQIAVEPMNPPSLIHLPDDYSELMNIVSEFSCPNSEREDSKYPTMCLVCGQILCSQSYCCQQEIRKSAGRGEPAGAAVLHCRTCGGGCGLFLRVRDCELLLLNAPSRGALLPAPYLDLYGETDQGLRRGNPLHLCSERYEKIRMLWLSHGVYERIARSLDTNMLVTRQWQDM